METKEIKINVPEGYEIDKKKSTLENIVFKKKEKTLPKTWEEFCVSNPIKEGEVEINALSEKSVKKPRVRYSQADRNILPSKELAEAMLALCQLIQLRECYNDGWKPDWTNDNFKYCIYVSKNELYKEAILNYNRILAFKTKELRDKFYDNFKDLIEVAKMLL